MMVQRITLPMYLELRAWLLQNDPDGRPMMDWAAQQCKPPGSPEKMASEIVWIILCAGRKAQAARTIEKKVWDAIHRGAPVVSVFGHKGKAAAIERAWRERAADYSALQQALASNDASKLVEWCGSIPYVGDDTKFQLSKNFGADVCKPDIWLCRLAGIPDKPRRNVTYRFETCMELCRYLAQASGDCIAVVDSMLWLACNKGVLFVSPEAGEVSFQPRMLTGMQVIQ